MSKSKATLWQFFTGAGLCGPTRPLGQAPSNLGPSSVLCGCWADEQKGKPEVICTHAILLGRPSDYRNPDLPSVESSPGGERFISHLKLQTRIRATYIAEEHLQGTCPGQCRFVLFCSDRTTKTQPYNSFSLFKKVKWAVSSDSSLVTSQTCAFSSTILWLVH